MKSIKFIVILLVFISCQQENNIPKSQLTQATFFDLDNFFEKEIEKLNSRQLTISKRVKLDETDETQQLSQIDFAKELKIFKESNINKLAWIESYEVDSVYTDNQLSEIHYRARPTDKKLKTRFLSVYYTQNKVSEIHILNQVRTALAVSEQNLQYKVDKGYTIKNLQEVSFSGPQELLIEVDF